MCHFNDQRKCKGHACYPRISSNTPISPVCKYNFPLLNKHCWVYVCYRKTALCDGDLNTRFSVPELVRSQSTFSTYPEVRQNCMGFTLCSSAGLAARECDTMYVVCTDLLCVVCIGLLSQL